MSTARCEHCKARVVWVTPTGRGRPMPCAPEVRTICLIPLAEASEGERAATPYKLVTTAGELISGYRAGTAGYFFATKAKPGLVEARLSHLATCPRRARWRAYRQSKAASR
jgi:hypothetical protein